MIEQYGKMVWNSSPDAGVLIIALGVLGIIYILFYRDNKNKEQKVYK